MWVLILCVGVLVAVAVYDVTQRQHTILRNFPIVGHLRYLLETVGPELRQYIVTNNDEERPFSRDQRRWVYATSKQQNNYFAFGTDNEMETAPNYLVIKHSAFPLSDPDAGDRDGALPCAKEWGAYRQRRKRFRPGSVISVSGMSYGSLSAAAVEAMNRGCKLAGCLHNTGEGGVSGHHLHGAEVIWQIGTGYFGCREPDGRFNMDLLVETVQRHPTIRAIELKMSQGAKPGLGGILPKAKISPEIAQARGIPVDRDCVSPPSHAQFRDADSLLDFVERIAQATGLPVGIKSAVGETRFWHELARLIATTGRAVDFIAIDGGEGGTGAAPLVFADHVALPFKIGFSRVYREFAQQDLHEKVVFVGSGKLGFPEAAFFAFALGCDMVAVAREVMLAIGCIQAQRCHTSHCPTGITTHNWWLTRGLDPTLKSVRAANYLTKLRSEIRRLSWACGVHHPALITTDHFEILDDRFGSGTIAQLFNYNPGLGLPSLEDRQQLARLMQGPTR